MQCQACSLSAAANTEEVDEEDDEGDAEEDTTFEFGIDGYATWLARPAPKDSAKILSYALEHAATPEQEKHACRVLAG